MVQFLASFISFYFEILSYLACGEKIIRLASKNSVKLDENQLAISSLSDMFQDTLFLWMRYIYKLRDVGSSSNLIGSLSAPTNGQCPPPGRWIMKQWPA